MKEVASFEFDDISDRTTTNAEFFDSSIAPHWMLCGKEINHCFMWQCKTW